MIIQRGDFCGLFPRVSKPADGDGNSPCRLELWRGENGAVPCVVGSTRALPSPSTILQLLHPNPQTPPLPLHSLSNHTLLSPHSKSSSNPHPQHRPSLIQAFCITVFGRRTGRIPHRPGMFWLRPEFCGSLPPSWPFPTPFQIKKKRRRSVFPAK